MKETLDARNWNLLKLQRYQQHDDETLVRLGLPSWESVKLRGTLYDHLTPLEEFLPMYASQFDAVEYHHSFAGDSLSTEMEKLKARVSSVNPDFEFCPLIPRRISHEFVLGENKFELQEFLEAVSVLGPHLGPCILRLPETFTPSSVKLLYRFFQQLPRELRVAVNFTNGEWFRKFDHMKSLLAQLRGSHISIVIEDRIELPMPAEQLLGSEHLLVRFFGRPNLDQDDQRLAMWVYKLGEFKGYGIRKSYFFLNEEEEMCLSLLSKMANSMGGRVRVPQKFDVNANQISFTF